MKYKQFESIFELLSLTLALTVAVLLHISTRTYSASCTITVTNTNDSGAGSFREAINSANANPNVDTICFSISGSGVHTISLTSNVPGDPNIDIVQPIVIDGTTQSGYLDKPLIVLDGTNTGDYPGLWITNGGSGSTIIGLGVVNFKNNGIKLEGSGNTLLANHIGISASGTSAQPNGGWNGGGRGGIGITSSNNIIGDGTVSGRNVISGNSGNGIDIYGQGISGNEIKGNYIGTDWTGEYAVANTADGILVGLSDANTIGGTNNVTPGGACTGDCNLISGNGYNGIGIWNEDKNGPITSKNNVVVGNFVGLDKDGVSDIGNYNIGIEIYNSPDNNVGDGTANGRNVSSGNGGAGLFITGEPSQNNVTKGNFFGTTTTGNNAIPNDKMGIGIGYSPGIEPAKNNIIGGGNGVTPGGDCTGDCNLISGNRQNGILISGFGNGNGGGNQIRGNYIGTTISGNSSLSNNYDGIGISSAPNNFIGGDNDNPSTWTSYRNIISGNDDNGIVLSGDSVTGNRISGNFIGTGSNGSNVKNQGNGILVASGIDTAILGNNISFNGKLGIDLGQNHISANDSGDNDSGANRIQNFPNIYSAKKINSTTKISGHFNGAPSTSFRFEFFWSDGCNAGRPDNYGEGQNFLGSVDYTTDIFGNVAYGFSTSTLVNGNKYITATATKKIGSIPAETSEFSQCILVDVDKPALTNGANWFLKYDLTTGAADKTYGYGFPSYYLMCAWDPNQPGVKLPVIVSGGVWFMRASYTTGVADLSFTFGSGSDKPICGDWNGDGTDTIGTVSPDKTWSLKNVNSSGSPDISFQYGALGTTPVVGDWNGDGTDTIGTVDNTNYWALRNSNNNGPADNTFNYGFTPSYKIVGDWNGDGTDTIGSISSGGTWNLRNSNSSGSPQVTFQYGFPGAKPLTW